MKLLNYNVIIKLKVIKFIKLIINNLKFTSVVARAIILKTSKLIEFILNNI